MSLYPNDTGIVAQVVCESMNAFYQWRQRIQRQHGFQWKVQNSLRGSTKANYTCNRSGDFDFAFYTSLFHTQAALRVGDRAKEARGNKARRV